MRLFLAYLNIRLKAILLYKHSIYISILTSAVLFIMQRSFWTYVGENSALNFNFTYYFVSLLIISPFISSEIDRDIQGKYMNGTLSINLLKPVSIFTQYLNGEIAGIFLSFIFRIIPLIIVIMCFIDIGFLLSVNIFHLLISLVMSFFMTWSLSFITGMSVVYFNKNEGFIQLKKILFSLFSGSMIPLDVLPDSIRPAFMLNPFRCIVDIPVRIMMNNPDKSISDLLTFQFIWTAVFAGLFIVVYKSTIRKINISGG